MVALYWLKNISIKSKIICSTTFLLSLLMTLLVADNFHEQVSFLKLQNKTDGIGLAQSISSTSISNVLSKDFSSINETLQAQKKVLDVNYISIFDKNKKILGHTNQQLVGSQMKVSFNTTFHDIQIITEDENSLVIASPISTNNSLIGWTLVSLNRNMLKHNKENLLLKGIYFILISTLIGLVFSIFIARSITRQLDSLKKTIQTFSSGTAYIQADESIQNEIGEIAKMFNSMASQLTNYQLTLVNSAKYTALGEMAAGIAHEINNPLAIIVGKTARLKQNLLLNNYNHNQCFSELEKIEKMGFRISKIIAGLKNFSRDSSKDDFAHYSIHKIIQETLDLCKERIEKMGYKITYEIEKDFNLNCNSTQISQVILNLINNAIDATAHLDEKWIRIELNSINDKIQIVITDCGLGISKEIQDKVMQPFFTTKDIGKGTGLGLSLSKGIIEKHNGSLLYNSLSAHTQFIIELNQEFSDLNQRKKAS